MVAPGETGWPDSTWDPSKLAPQLAENLFYGSQVPPDTRPIHGTMCWPQNPSIQRTNVTFCWDVHVPILLRCGIDPYRFSEDTDSCWEYAKEFAKGWPFQRVNYLQTRSLIGCHVQSHQKTWSRFYEHIIVSIESTSLYKLSAHKFVKVYLLYVLICKQGNKVWYVVVMNCYIRRFLILTSSYHANAGAASSGTMCISSIYEDH